MRDWTKTLRGASFRGVPFWVQREEMPESGRRVVEHGFAKAEEHDTEDMGRKARKWNVTGYVVGDVADAQAQALIAACSVSGPGLLVLPFLGAVEVRCTNCHVGHELERLGYAECTLEFIEAGGQTFPALALGDRIAGNLLSTLGPAVGTALRAFGG